MIPNLQQVGSRNIPLEIIIEDEVMRDSATSYIHQMVDVIAYFAKQVYQPNSFFKKKGITRFYGNLMTVVNKWSTYYSTNFKIVEV